MERHVCWSVFVLAAVLTQAAMAKVSEEEAAKLGIEGTEECWKDGRQWLRRLHGRFF